MLLDLNSLFIDGTLQIKFIRVSNEIHIPPLDDPMMLHIELAKKDKILERIEELKEFNPDAVDGGRLYIMGKILRVGAESTTLNLPLTQKARKTTLQVLDRKYPSFNIKELSEV